MMLLLLIALYSVLISSTTLRTIDDTDDTETSHYALEFEEFPIEEPFEEGVVELQNSGRSFSQSDLRNVSLLESIDVNSETSSVQLAPKEKRSIFSKRTLALRDAPNLCENVPIDSFTTTKNGNTYVFKGDFYWKIKGDNGIFYGYPKLISEDWDGLPGYVDASLTWPGGSTLFFKGKQYWKFVNKYMDPGYPKPISEGFPGIPDYLDAAVVLHGDGKAYFFKGRQYWQYDSSRGVSGGYPKSIEDDWDGVPSYLDAAFRWDNNHTYLFKDDVYYKIIDRTLDVDSVVYSNGKRYPLPIAEEWFGC